MPGVELGAGGEEQPLCHATHSILFSISNLLKDNLSALSSKKFLMMPLMKFFLLSFPPGPGSISVLYRSPSEEEVSEKKT